MTNISTIGMERQRDYPSSGPRISASKIGQLKDKSASNVIGTGVRIKFIMDELLDALADKFKFKSQIKL